MMRPSDVSIYLRWAVSPNATLTLLLAIPTHYLLPTSPSPHLDARSLVFRGRRLDMDRPPNKPLPAILPPLRVPTPASAPFSSATTRHTQLYIKGPLDIPLLLWTIVLCSYLRLVFTLEMFPRVGR
ncbi:hypothetical protein C8F04DRAFT_1273527 [Mycena alexandri]|uniref:Uncharacterized protein n=1 Tax=Mycena alexandri TaxID=1745969 RepID=A0AAD6WNY1_9AGAR|nr:hypothetical protein C8F04DRAFT_1273527 [Mycena alexandri]